MKNKTFRSALILLALIALPLWAAGRVEMGTPILKTSPGEITVTTSFSSFDSASQYRVGVGLAGKSFQKLQIQLLKNNSQISRNAESFSQGFTSTWFNVDSLQVRGYGLSGRDLPGSSGRVTLKVTLPREEADRLGKFFIVVSRNYGGDTWYLEDGTEVNNTHW